MKFLGKLFGELGDNGKLLVTYIVSQIPGATSVPGLGTAINTAIADHTPAAYIDLGLQLLMLAAALVRTKKIVVAATDKA